MDWSDVEQSQPRLAELGRQRLLGPGVVLVGTIRRDGTPRLSPVEPYLMDGHLWLSMLWQSTKARDLLRDPRILIHSIVTSRDGGDGEYKVRGSAHVVADPDVQRAYAEAVGRDLGWHPQPGRFHLFRIDIEHITFIRFDDSTGNQSVAVWPPAREFLRRGTSATSVGEPETIHDILV